MDTITEYIKALEIGNKSPHTIRVYKKDLKKFVSFFSIKTLDDLKKLKAADFHRFYANEDMKPASLNGLIRSINAFFGWLIGSGIVEESEYNEFSKVKFGGKKFVDVPKVKKLILTEDEQVRLIEAGGNYQERFMIAVLLFTGIRRGEAVNIKLSDISGCKITINGKGDKQRNVYLDDTLCHMLNIYMAERKTNSKYLFYATRGDANDDGKLGEDSIYDRIKAAGERAGIDPERLAKLSPHRLRGTAITRLCKLFGVSTAQLVAGHSSINTTKIYNEGEDEIVMNALLGQRSALATYQK